MTIECCLEVDKRLLFIKHKRKTDYGDFSLSSYLLVLEKLVKHIPSTFFVADKPILYQYTQTKDTKYHKFKSHFNV